MTKKEMSVEEKTQMEKLTELLSQDMSKMEPQERGNVFGQALKIISDITEVAVKPEMTVVSVDLRKKKESTILT